MASTCQTLLLILPFFEFPLPSFLPHPPFLSIPVAIRKRRTNPGNSVFSTKTRKFSSSFFCDHVEPTAETSTLRSAYQSANAMGSGNPERRCLLSVSDNHQKIYSAARLARCPFRTSLLLPSLAPSIDLLVFARERFLTLTTTRAFRILALDFPTFKRLSTTLLLVTSVYFPALMHTVY